MRKAILILMTLTLYACSSTPKLDANEEFERLYIALGMEEILSSFGGEINISPEQLFSETLRDLPESQKRVFIESIPSKVMTDPINVNAAKVVFKLGSVDLYGLKFVQTRSDLIAARGL